MMTKVYPKEVIQKIRREVLAGKSKYQVAKEMEIADKVIYYHTRDIPSKNPGRTEIRGKTLELLKELLQKGHINCRSKCSPNFHTLQKHFPVIKRTQIDHKAIYYLEDKNKEALRGFLEDKRSRVINFQDLANMTKIFDVHLSKNEKHGLLSKSKPKKSIKNRSSRSDSLLENEDSLAYFCIRGYCFLSLLLHLFLIGYRSYP